MKVGLIFKLEGPSKVISWLAACRFSMEGYGTTVNLNSLPTKFQQQGFLIEHAAEDSFVFTTAHFTHAAGMLCLFTIAFSIVAGIVLRNVKGK
jgi:hypothetical protein